MKPAKAPKMKMQMLSKWPAMKANYLIVLLAITLFPSSPVRGEQPTHNNEPTLIRSVNLVDVASGSVTPEMDVLLADGRIQQIGHKLLLPKGTRVVDGTKRFLVPGLWDMHVHTAGLSANPDWSRDTLLPLLVANGVTGIRDMGGNLEALQTWKRQISQGELVGPQIVMAGPMLDGDSDDPSVIAVKTPDQARHTVDQLAAQHVDFIKVLSGLDRDSYFAVVAESKAQHLPIVGHVPTVVGTAEASQAGQKSIEHILYGGIAIACSSREEELRGEMAKAMQSGSIRQVAKVEDAADESFSEEKAQKLWATFRQNKTWVVPTLVSTFVSSHLDELSASDPDAEYLPKSVRDGWTPEKLKGAMQPDKLAWWKREVSEQTEMVRRMHQAGVAILAGTDSLDTHNVPGFALVKELELLVHAGFTPMEALQSATIRPAEFLRLSDAGNIVAGNAADLLLLDADPTAGIENVKKIQSVFVKGRYFSRSDLDHMLDAIRVHNCGVACLAKRNH
jgi:imidazolonepropionase-like amidohydrolase